MFTELQNEYGSDHLILMRGRGGAGGGGESCLEYFSLARSDPGFFSPKIFTPTQIKIKWSLSKKKKKTEKVSDW